MNSKKILVTGFEAFGGESLNPSYEIIKVLQAELIKDSNFIFACLPVEYETAQNQMKALIFNHNPSIWLGLGQAGGRDKINLERVAINWMEVDSKTLLVKPDLLRPTGSPAYFNKLDLVSLKNILKHQGVDAEVSLSAGGYICNAVYYTWFENTKSSVGLFVHLPYLPEQHKDQPHLNLEIQVCAVRIILDALQVNSGS